MSTTLHLYEITSELRAINDEIIDADGELDGSLEARLDAWTAALEVKADNLCAVIAEHRRAAEAAKAEADRLYERMQQHRRAEDRLKAYLQKCLELAGLDRVRGERFAVSRCRNSRPTLTWGREPGDLPAEYRRVRVELDGEAAYRAWREGTLPEGFTAVVGEHLRIR